MRSAHRPLVAFKATLGGADDGYVSRIHAQYVVGALVLVLATAAGWAVTTWTQRHVPVMPGVEGCFRLEGSARQTDCLATQFQRGANERAGSRTGQQRATAVAAFVRVAEREAAADPRIGNICHPAMHELGRDEGKRAARDGRLPTFPGEGTTQLCTAGYVHGLAEGYLRGAPAADVAGIFPKLCADEASRAGCAHGVGHALLQGRGEEPARVATDAATTRCTELPAAVHTDCEAGVFMELAMRRAPEVTPVAAFVDLCEGRPDTGQRLACWSYLTLSVSTNDSPPSSIAPLCATASSVVVQSRCLESYGRELGVDGVGSCATVNGDDTMQQRCVNGALGLQVGSGHVSEAAARDACRDQLAGTLEDGCLDAVTRYSSGRAAVEAGEA